LSPKRNSTPSEVRSTESTRISMRSFIPKNVEVWHRLPGAHFALD
jgi:hypothetical protein